MRLFKHIYFGPRCWIWCGALTEKGYGHCQHEGRTWRVHRLMYFILTGEQPPVVMHLCNNPSCCNPAHLRAGTTAENNRMKGPRAARGEANGSAFLTEAEVVAIRQRITDGDDWHDIAASFAVSRANIGRIARRETWEHVASSCRLHD